MVFSFFFLYIFYALQNCEVLKIVDLSSSMSLEEIPDFSSLVSLEELILYNCRNLVKVHESVGSIGKLVKLDLEWCGELRELQKY